MTEIVKRQLVKEDAGEALTVQRAAFLAEARVYGTEIPPLLESFEDMQREIETTYSFGAFSGQRLVGSIRLGVDGPIGWISRVAVAPDQQGRGIASGLIGTLEHAAPTSVSEFRLMAGARSTQNRAMYERRGFREVGRMIDAAGIELVVMRKERSRLQT